MFASSHLSVAWGGKPETQSPKRETRNLEPNPKPKLKTRNLKSDTDTETRNRNPKPKTDTEIRNRKQMAGFVMDFFVDRVRLAALQTYVKSMGISETQNPQTES